MPRYVVTVTETRSYDIVVDAKSPEDAEPLAMKEYDEVFFAYSPYKVEAKATNIRDAKEGE